MQKEDLQQIADLIKSNNKVLLKKVDNKIDELAIIVNQGFNDVEKRFDSLEHRIENVEIGQENIIMKLDNACPVR